MKKYGIGIIAVMSIALVVAACNKTKSTSKCFIKAGEWHVTELSIDGVSEEELPHWTIGDCNIYKESCIGSWENQEGGATDFVWQIKENGEKFVISRQGPDEGLEHADEEMATQCFGFSGTYDIVENEKTRMKFTSTTLPEFPGQAAVIVIEKK